MTRQFEGLRYNMGVPAGFRRTCSAGPTPAPEGAAPARMGTTSTRPGRGMLGATVTHKPKALSGTRTRAWPGPGQGPPSGGEPSDSEAPSKPALRRAHAPWRRRQMTPALTPACRNVTLSVSTLDRLQARQVQAI